jgi:hypothetical protein
MREAGHTAMNAKPQADGPAHLFKRLGNCVRFVFSRNVIHRNLFIAVVVGCILSGANQYDVIARTSFTAKLGLKIFFNFLVPFIVSSASAAVTRQDN